MILICIIFQKINNKQANQNYFCPFITLAYSLEPLSHYRLRLLSVQLQQSLESTHEWRALHEAGGRGDELEHIGK